MLECLISIDASSTDFYKLFNTRRNLVARHKETYELNSMINELEDNNETTNSRKEVHDAQSNLGKLHAHCVLL